MPTSRNCMSGLVTAKIRFQDTLYSSSGSSSPPSSFCSMERRPSDDSRDRSDSLAARSAWLFDRLERPFSLLSLATSVCFSTRAR